MQASGVDTVWHIMATFLVLLMQCGFLMLEGGRVRSKNSISVAQKNASDLVIVWIAFFAVGFHVMFGQSLAELANGSNAQSTATPISFIFQAAFACTTATIISGAIAERMSYRAYLILVASMTTLCYPLAGRLVWGNTYNADVSAPLAELGFVDFAGSTVVHSAGAWFALVALLMIGPRLGRFNADGSVEPLAAHSSVMALFGVLILMLGWIGFNGGLVSPSDPLLQMILLNTLGSACFGALAGMAVGVRLDNGLFNPGRISTGLLGGLVACTACVHLMTIYDAVVVGALGGIIATYGAHVLLHRFRLDDPLDVIATHGLAGIAGTLAVAFLMPESDLAGNSRLTQFGVQLLGICVVFVLSCSVCWLTIVVLRRFVTLRVSEQAETIGLNFAEHGESMGLSRLQQTLEVKAAEGSSFSGNPLVSAGDEHADLAVALGNVLQKYESANEEVAAANRRFQQFAETATDWLWETDSDLSISFVHARFDDKGRNFSDALLGRHLLDIFAMQDETMRLVSTAVQQQQDTLVFEAILKPWHGADTQYDVEVRGVVYNDAEAQFCGYRGTITDITDRKSAQSHALYLSRHDELTGLPNRRALSEDIEGLLQAAQESNKAVVLAGVDLDGFKAINDDFGHQAGDELLRQVANRMQQFLRSSDVAYRTGGDEFVIVLDQIEPNVVTRASVVIMQRLIDELSRAYNVQSIDVNVGVSIGLSYSPQDDTTFRGLMYKADLALYSAKARGKGCAVVFRSDMDSQQGLRSDSPNPETCQSDLKNKG